MMIVPHLRTGGGQKLVLDIISNMDHKVLDILVISLYPSEGNIFETFAVEKGINVKYLNKKEGMDISVIKQIKGIISSFRPEIIHAHLTVMPYILLPLIMSGVKKRFYTVHNLAERDASHHKYMKMILKFSFKYANVIPIAISETCKQSIISYYNLPEDKIPCIYNGIDTNKFKCIIPYEQRKSESLTFIATGRMEPQKNYELMLRAFAEVHQTYPNTKLVVLGDGYLRKELENEIDRLNISEAVVLKGRVSNVEEELNKAHIYLMSSNWEGLPLSLMEAMSCGLPVIATKAGGVLDIVREHENGYLINLNDKESFVKAMIELIQQPELRKRYSTASLRESKTYDIKICAKRHLELYLK